MEDNLEMNEKEFDEAIEKLEVAQVDLDESDFGLTEERDSTLINQSQRYSPEYAREYEGRWVDDYSGMWQRLQLDGYNYNANNDALPPIDLTNYRNYSYHYHQNMSDRMDRMAAGYDRSLYHRDGENPVYHVRPEVININRDYDWIYEFNSPAPSPHFYRPATVKFVVRCPSCHGQNEITVSQDILLRNPDPHITCLCGAQLIIEGRW
jgi:hypothetical protein